MIAKTYGIRKGLRTTTKTNQTIYSCTAVVRTSFAFPPLLYAPCLLGSYTINTTLLIGEWCVCFPADRKQPVVPFIRASSQRRWRRRSRGSYTDGTCATDGVSLHGTGLQHRREKGVPHERHSVNKVGGGL